MTNPFDDPNRDYVVLRNGLGEHSIWPATVPVPPGWWIALPERGRAACIEFIEKNWQPAVPRVG
jgi:MbtH protein